MIPIIEKKIINHEFINKTNPINNSFILEAKKYINNNPLFKNNYGNDEIYYPIDFENTKIWFKNFMKNKLLNFGDYQDACLKTLDDPFLYHSAITPMLNIGLITDNEIIDYFNKFYKKNPNIGFNSYEGFIRQLIGWRNYIYASYILLHKLENNNNLQNNNKINKELIWKGETGILFIDNIMKKIWKFAYIHHIERLMYLGCFLLLLQIKPQEVYNLFMEWTIDAYNWVMFGNVYGMSQYSIDSLMKRPYFCSSNYIIRMSNYKYDTYMDIFDALYYNFIVKKYALIKNNYMFASQYKHWQKKTPEQQKEILSIAKNFINKICINKAN